MALFSVAAPVTKKLNLATGICLVVHRGLIQTTKLVVSLEQLSSGRFLFGIEVGWNVKQMADHGTKFKIRTSRMNEQIEVMEVRWTEEKESYERKFINFSEMVTSPKPVQKSHPPIILGEAFPYGG